MINVLCVKVGTKYSAEYVNRLHRMVSRYLSVPFTFYCYTDDPHEVDANIIPVESDYLETYWNKLAMFQENFVPEGTCLYFDLDTVIQNPINSLLDYLSDNLTMVNCYWKNGKVTYGDHTKEKDRWDMYVNSSVLLWKSNQLTYIWDHFQKNPDYFMVQYKGIDRFLFHEKIPIDLFPEGLIYSRLFGDLEKNKQFANLVKNQTVEYSEMKIDYDEIYLFHHPDHLVCMFNGPTKEWMYKDLEYHWS